MQVPRLEKLLYEWIVKMAFTSKRLYKNFAANSQKQNNFAAIDFRHKNRQVKIQALWRPKSARTIVNFCGLDERHIDCAVEINPHKLEKKYIVPRGTKILAFDEAKGKSLTCIFCLCVEFC